MGFFSFVANWTNYFLPYVMLPDSDQYPRPGGRGHSAQQRAAVQPDRRQPRNPTPELALATLVAITPVLVVFLFSQRFLVAGMLAGATKE